MVRNLFDMGKYIETPEKLWELFTAYKKKIKDNPILVHDFVGKDGISAERRRERPLTLEGFECYVMEVGVMGCNDLSAYFDKKSDSYAAYWPTVDRIKKMIRADQIEGGMANIYNPQITQRLNGLVEKTDNVNHNIEVKAEFGSDNK